MNRKLVPVFVPGLLGGASAVGLLATSGWLIARASEHPPVLSLCVAIGAVQAFSLGRGLARYFQRLGVHQLSLERLGRLRLELFDLLEPRVPGSTPGGKGAVALTGLVSDADAVAEGFAKGLGAATDVAASIVLGTLLASIIEPRLGLVLLAGSLGVVAVSWALSEFAAKAETDAASARTALTSLVSETVRSARELVAYGREDLVQDRLREVRKRSASAAQRSALATGAAKAGAVAAAGGALVAVVATGLDATSAGRLSGPVLAAVAFAALAVLDQCMALPAALAVTATGHAARARISELSSLPAIQEPLSDPGDLAVPATALPATAALEGAEVTLAGGTRALSGASLAVAAGSRVAITGPSGAGKTTAVHALLHFVECSAGRASLGGLDVKELARPAIAGLVGWLPDETHLFAASLRDNLRIARPAANDADCVAVLERVGLAGWLTSLPEGLDTRLGAGGRPVSGGEAQRIGMARALLSGARLVLLDEPTARLDPATSAQVLSELLGAATQRSVLVVTHEPDVVGLVDEVVGLDGGRVVARRGTATERSVAGVVAASREQAVREPS